MIEICYVLLGICLLIFVAYLIELVKAHIWLDVFIKLENYKVDLNNSRKYNTEVLNNEKTTNY